MAANVQWTDEYTLLCEKCGYVIEGLPTEGKCPECGKPILLSLPERRRGSAWQRNEGHWRGMILGPLLSPVRQFDQATIERPDSTHLILDSTAIASLAACAGVLPYVVTRLIFTEGMLLLILSGLAGTGLCIVLRLLIKIEEIGIRIVGARRGWRVTPDVARTVTAHSAIGWLVGCALQTCVTLVWTFLQVTVLEVEWSHWLHHDYYVLVSGAALMIGLLHFEILVYLGVRRCRFANRARPAAPPSPDPNA